MSRDHPKPHCLEDVLSILWRTETTEALLFDCLSGLSPDVQEKVLCDDQGNYAKCLKSLLYDVVPFSGWRFNNVFWTTFWKTLSNQAKNRLLNANSRDQTRFITELSDALIYSDYSFEFFITFFETLPERKKIELLSNPIFCRRVIKRLDNKSLTADDFSWIWSRLSMRLKGALITVLSCKNVGFLSRFQPDEFDFHRIIHRFVNQATHQPSTYLLNVLYTEPERFSNGILACFNGERNQERMVVHQVAEFLEDNTIQVLWYGLTPDLRTLLAQQKMKSLYGGKSVIHYIQANARPSDFLSFWHQLDKETQKMADKVSKKFEASAKTVEVLPLFYPIPSPSSVISVDEFKAKRFNSSVCFVDWNTLVSLDLKSPELSVFKLLGGNQTITQLTALKDDGTSLVLLVNHNRDLTHRFADLLDQQDPQYRFSNVRKPFLSLFDAVVYRKGCDDKLLMLDIFHQVAEKSGVGEYQHFLIDHDKAACDRARRYRMLPYSINASGKLTQKQQSNELDDALQSILADAKVSKQRLIVAPYIGMGFIGVEAGVSSVVAYVCLQSHVSTRMSIGAGAMLFFLLMGLTVYSYHRYSLMQHHTINLAEKRDAFFNQMLLNNPPNMASNNEEMATEKPIHQNVI